MRMKKTKRKRELQEGEYGRNCRQSLSSSSTDYNAAVRYKTKEQPSHDRREKEQKKRRNIKNTNRHIISTTRRRKRTAMKEEEAEEEKTERKREISGMHIHIQRCSAEQRAKQ